MPKAKFYLDKPEKDYTYIMMSFAYHGKRVRYSSQQKIKTKDWNDNKREVRQSYENYAFLNQHLKTLSNKVDEYYLEYKTKGIIPTPKQLREKLDIYNNRAKEVQKLTLFEFIESYLVEIKGKRAVSTIKSHRKIFNHLKKYAKSRNRTLDFEDIDLEFYHDYLDYLYEAPNMFGLNTAGDHIKHIKTFLGVATEKGINTNLKFRGKLFKKPSEETTAIYLNVDELGLIYNLQLEKFSRLDNVRDLFIVGCYTGLRFGDFSRLTNDNILERRDNDGRPYRVLRVFTNKTGATVEVPLTPHVKAIFEKHSLGKGYVIPRSISNQKMNEYLKELGQIAGLTERVLKAKSKGGKRIEVSKKKYELISTHTARRSFATNAFLAGVPTISIMKITGHKTEKAFMKYIKISEEDNARINSTHLFFNEVPMAAVK